MSVTRFLAVWMMGSLFCTACRSAGDGGSDDLSNTSDGGQTGGDEGTGETDSAGAGTGGNGDMYPLFGLARSEICTAWCAQYESCLTEQWADNGLTAQVCIEGCQTTLDEAVAGQNAEGRENCPPSIDSLYACQAQTCEDFQAGSNPELGWANCGRIEQQFLDECTR